MGSLSFLHGFLHRHERKKCGRGLWCSGQGSSALLSRIPCDLLDGGGGNCITAADLDSGQDIYIEIPQAKIKQLAPVTTLIVQNFLTAFMSRPDKSSGKKLRPILFLLDEFPQLQFDFDSLNSALSTLRSKGVSLFLAMQSISQLQQRYGDAGFKTILDTCSIVSVMSAQEPSSREWFSKLCGERHIYKVSTSSGGTTSGESNASRTISEEWEPVFRPADFGSLRDREKGKDDVIIVYNGKYVRAEKTYCYQ